MEGFVWKPFPNFSDFMIFLFSRPLFKQNSPLFPASRSFPFSLLQHVFDDQIRRRRMPNVYIVNSPAAADWKVYFVSSPAAADERVYVVSSPASADKKVYVVSSPASADKKVYKA